ncbi:hypothetical protein D7Y44_00235 [Stenotrophomonas maltophilia]|uniref:hypothetical protein n=1 Tax=Stenotrophomonas maltophilia TaxID=40324 RepID=UPI0015DF9614|nr:hypothetical protein [Stenotrophomonas maltophilia]MBA0279712.1 hypothetical protein [Stenotrophomonas maltophilia]MBA0343640.1 hypothetical protein [Stenotrophomonas maltophilia]MBA0355879.1 hypothetical protein [Stenotrophomonas maltophilia]MBA0517900.1 hypothetical protein [Stenotrophomonas maltophilia]
MSDEFQYSKQEVADAHFDAACKAFLSSAHPAVVVTLSAVAEEIYGALISDTLGWLKEQQPRAIDTMVDWACRPESAGGLGMESKAAWKFLYATKNAVKHARDPSEPTTIDPAAMVYILIGAIINRLRLGRPLEGEGQKVAQVLVQMWHQKPSWVTAEAEKWEQQGV